jgi:hypothetical protein
MKAQILENTASIETTMVELLTGMWRREMEANAFGSRINDMFGYRKKTSVFPNWKGIWYPLNFLIIMLLVAHLASGCVSPPSMQLYENPESGISLEKPENWDLAFYERSGVIVLEAENGSGNKDSARIEIHGSACVPAPTWFNGPDEEIEANIDRIRDLYYLGSALTIVQEPVRVETGDYEVTKAIIMIPTMSLSEDDVINQVGARGPDIFQIIEMFAIINSNNNFIMVYVYKGNSEELNAEAQEIVDSIQLTCLTEP